MITLWKNLLERRIFQSVVIYVAGSWGILEATDFFINKYNWSQSIFDYILVILISGLPLSIIWSWFHGQKGNQATSLTEITLITINIFVMVGTVYWFSLDDSRFVHFKSSKRQLAESIRTIAILPFKNFSQDSSQNVLISGMHSALINQLGRIGELNVISEPSVLRYNGQKLNEFATDVGADGIVEVSVMMIADNYELDVSLISPYPEEIILWSDNLSFPKGQLQQQFRKVVLDVARKINLALSSDLEDLMTSQQKTNPAAYEAFIKGKFLSEHIPTKENLDEALGYFNKSIELDSTFAPAYAGVSWVWISRLQLGFASGLESRSNLLKYNHRALELDPNYYESQYHKAVISMQNWDWESSERAYLKAIELYPNHVFAHAHYSHLLMYLKRYEDALPHLKIAEKLDPLNPHILGLCAVVYLSMGENEKALKLIERYPTTFGREGILEILAYKNDHLQESLDYLIMQARIDSSSANKTLEEFRNNGYKAAITLLARMVDEKSPHSQPILLSILYSRAGLIDDAFRQLELCYEQHNPNLQYLFALPLIENLKGEERYTALAKKLQVPS